MVNNIFNWIQKIFKLRKIAINTSEMVREMEYINS